MRKIVLTISLDGKSIDVFLDQKIFSPFRGQILISGEDRDMLALQVLKAIKMLENGTVEYTLRCKACSATIILYTGFVMFDNNEPHISKGVNCTWLNGKEDCKHTTLEIINKIQDYGT